MPRGNRTKTVKKLAGAGSCRDSAAASCGDGNHVCMVYPDRAASTNVTPTGGTISKGDAVLLISASADGPFEQ